MNNTLQTRKLGASSLEVSALGLGCMELNFSYEVILPFRTVAADRKNHGPPLRSLDGVVFHACQVFWLNRTGRRRGAATDRQMPMRDYGRRWIVGQLF